MSAPPETTTTPELYAFESFNKIVAFKDLQVVITEKIHGTNAQILINDTADAVLAGSRNRWLTPKADNFGFAQWVEENRTELIATLGPGRHFGEWYGSGLGLGYGLREKRFALFNTSRWANAKLPPRVDVVPVLYFGPYSVAAIEATKATLLEKGSVLVPGYMKPEGIVAYFPEFRKSLKQVFDEEAVGWARKEKPAKVEAAALALLQPVRLEKLMMRDERYWMEYPKSLRDIVQDYFIDLVSETPNIDPAALAFAKDRAFRFVKSEVAAMQRPL